MKKGVYALYMYRAIYHKTMGQYNFIIAGTALQQAQSLPYASFNHGSVYVDRAG